MKRIALSTTSDFILVDDDDYVRCLRISWRLNNIKSGVIGRGPSGMTTLARFILTAAEEVDHIDRDILNNQKSNLRQVTKSVNCHNKQAPATNTSGFKGVHWNAQKQKWQARVTSTIKGIKMTTHIGFYSSAQAAANGYDLYVRTMVGLHVLTNKDMT